ncbi:MAG: L,D-transpeptidase family protein [Gammaproteobacteria bacterium]|nr:L,D-transpeptidase family protein [Gammaproteobacteria bacterium]
MLQGLSLFIRATACAALAACALAPNAAIAQVQETGVAAAAPGASSVSPLAEAIRERVDHLRYEQQHDVRGARIIVDDLVAKYYEGQQFQPAWQDTAKLDALITGIEDLRNDGLDPNDYHVEALRSYRLDVRMKSPLTLQDRADLELLATDAFMLGLYHVYIGKVDPEKLSSQWNFSQRPTPSIDEALQRFKARLAAGEINDAFAAVRPTHPWYQRGRERLQEYRAIAAAGGWPGIADGPVLKPGMSDTRVPVLRKRLSITRDLPASLASVTPEAADLYDASLEQGVKAFQERHGLTADGVIGPGTRAAMNVPVQQRIDQIRVNLERARWTLHEMKGEFVLVDVAGFYVSYFRNDEPIWTSKVVVGRDQRETPIFRSKITYVVFNPTWTIPPGILVKDKLPELKRNPGALKRMNIRVLDGSGREVNPYSVNWNQYGPSRLPPYQFVQDPGPNNALGLVKVMFPNPYLVYLHDSPAKSLFEQDQRTFSSGCIRVQKPFELAELVLNDPQWNKQSIDAVIATKETRTVNLKQPVPVLILYWTAQPRPDGQVIFRNDVYGRDAQTLAALNSDFRVPTVATTTR